MIAIGLVDKERECPNHGDKDNVLVRFTHEQGGSQEEDDGRERKKNPEGEPLLDFLLDYVFCRLFHRKHPASHFNLHYFPLQATMIMYF